MSHRSFTYKTVPIFFLLSSCITSLYGQDRFELFFTARARSRRIPEKTVTITKSPVAIHVDGLLDESIWKEAEKASGFHQNFPSDQSDALSKTEARFTYDEHGIYAGITCFDAIKGKYIIESLKRDFRDENNDYIMLILDPFDDLTNGYVFALTPMGSQMEGLVSGGGGGFMPISTSWDNIWFSEVRRTDTAWTAEIRIPFKTIRYNDKITAWNLQLVRNDLKRNERSTWTHVARQYRPTSLTFSGQMKWDTVPPPAGANISIIPYLSGAADQDMDIGREVNFSGKAGFDGKIALSSSMNLDLTVLPDFSTVEVDEQQTNVTRFELFFPEKRQFFLENSDLFTDFGFRRSQVFFSRRIGLDATLLFGARLSGQLGPGVKVGLLNSQTANLMVDDEDDIPAYNFTVATIRKQVFGRSSISAIFTNKQAINYEKNQNDGYDFGERNRFNRVYGLQYNLLTANDKWTGSIYGFRSDDPVHQAGNWAHGASLRYNVKNISVFWTQEYIGKGFNAEMGFFPRTDYIMFGPFIRYQFYPESKVINRHGPGLRFFNYLDTDWNLTDRMWALNYRVNFQNTSELELEVEDTYVKLFDDFDPTYSGDEDSTIVPLPAGSDYHYQNINLNYQSDSRRDFSFEVRAGYGGFYNGTGLNVTGRIVYRIRLYFNLGLGYSYNSFNLPDPYPDGSFWLIGPRIELTFTDKIYWINYIQYNQQADNVNINSRFQWRFAPASDLFVVYTENFLPQGLKTKNRGIVIKISYWFNI
ncbi:MAG: DUF5916 domain-containing protein [Bacteroidales bacterium]